MQRLLVCLLAVGLGGCLVPARPVIVAAPMYHPSPAYPPGPTYVYPYPYPVQPYGYHGYRHHPYRGAPILVGQPAYPYPRPKHMGPQIPRKRW